MSKKFFLVNCLLILSALSLNVTNGFSLYEKQLMDSEEQLLKEYNHQHQDSIQVIRNLLVFIIKNNQCFSDDELYQQLTALLEKGSKQSELKKTVQKNDLNKKRSLLVSKYPKENNLRSQLETTSFHDIPIEAAKRKLVSVDKKGYDYGTILYIGKRSQQAAKKRGIAATIADQFGKAHRIHKK